MKKEIYLLVLAILLFTVNGCSKKTANVIRINDSGMFYSAVQTIIKEKNLLEPYLPDGATIEWSSLANNTEIRDAIVSDRLDIASMIKVSYINALENGLPLTLLAETAGTQSFTYSNNHLIRNFDDITDSTKIVFGSKLGNGAFAFYLLCATQYGDPFIFDKNIREMSVSDSFSSVAAGLKDIDIFNSGIPYSALLDEMDHVKKIIDLTPIMKEHGIGSVFFTSDNFYNKNRNLVDAFMKAANDAVKYINENPNEAAQLLAKAYNSSPKDVEDELRAWPINLEVRGYDELANLMYEMGMFSKPPKKFSDFHNYDSIPKK